MARKDNNRRSLYIADEALVVIGNPDSLSGRINAVITRYGRIVTEAMPTFTEKEWLAICDANNGSIMDDMPQSVAYIWANVADSDLSQWDVDPSALALKIRDLNYAGACAVAEVINGFWKNDGLNQESYGKILVSAGAKISP